MPCAAPMVQGGIVTVTASPELPIVAWAALWALVGAVREFQQPARVRMTGAMVILIGMC